ncbi:MAG: transposase [Proteobacteria bacterium]|nr:transposase [Pseudomonadota bacterium]
MNGKLRTEFLNQYWIRLLDKAGWKINKWREHYNNVRPHSSLGYLPPQRGLLREQLKMNFSSWSCD